MIFARLLVAGAIMLPLLVRWGLPTPAGIGCGRFPSEVILDYLSSVHGFPAAQRKDWRHGQPRRRFEGDDTPLLASNPTLSAGKND
jgi:hypothetical protein